MLTNEVETVSTFTHLGEVNYGTNWENQIACDFRATLAQALADQENQD